MTLAPEGIAMESGAASVVIPSPLFSPFTFPPPPFLGYLTGDECIFIHRERVEKQKGERKNPPSKQDFWRKE